MPSTADEGEDDRRRVDRHLAQGHPEPWRARKRLKSLLVEEKVAIEHEAYISITIDCTAKEKRVTFIVTAQGGMDIEEVADKARPRRDPPSIGSIPRSRLPTLRSATPVLRLKTSGRIRKRIPGGRRRDLQTLLRIRRQLGRDRTRFVLTKDGRVIASDAKADLDGQRGAGYKHPELAEWEKENESPENEDEAKALAIGLGRSNYAKLDGNIGVMANGAGLGMGTMDAIRNAGGKAANFLDVGGGAQAQRVRDCYELVVSDPKVKAMFINIFGGITRADQVATGIVEALSGNDLRKVPLVVRLTGTNEKEGREILAKANITSVQTMDEGAAKAVALAKSA